MKKADLLAQLQSEDFDRTALVEQLQAESQKTEPFRNRPEIRAHIDSFNTARRESFQPAIYKKDPEVLAVALKEMVTELESIVALVQPTPEPEPEPTKSRRSK